MTTTYYSFITHKGLLKHAKAAGTPTKLDLAKIIIGDGQADPSPEDESLQNKLEFETPITHIKVDGTNPNQLIVEGVFDEEIGPFTMREVGVVDSDGDLFAIAKFPETFKPNLPSGVGKKLYIRMILGFANSPNVNLISSNINTDPNFSTRIDEELDDRLKISANLADLSDVDLARTNLGIGAINQISGLNHIINGNFDIWQRGIVFDQSHSFGPDRWRVWNSGSSAVSFARQEFVLGQNEVSNEPKYYININCTNANDSVGLLQYIEDVRTLANKTATISFWAKADSNRTFITRLDQRYSSNSGDEDLGVVATHNLTTSWQKFTHTVNIPSIAGKILGEGHFLKLVMVNPNNETSSIDIAQVKIEEGEFVTSFKSRHISEELALCQRYYQKSYPMDTSPGTITGEGILSYFSDRVSMTQGGQISYVPEMRIVPSMDVYDPKVGTLGVGHRSDGAKLAFINMGGGHNSRQGRFYFPAGQSTGRWITWHWTADAEL
ncbi:MAG: hypothetical protein ACJAZX_000421 [Rickettsiales bacterium]|jgi:hypothetical protein